MNAFTAEDIERCLSDNGCLAIPTQFTTIADCAGRANCHIRSITFLGPISQIGSEAFSCCSNLERIDLPASLETMGEYAFSSCNIKELFIPGSLAVIPPNAFSYCTSLNQITLECGIRSISSQAFADCGRPLRICIPSSVTSIADNAFDSVLLPFSNFKPVEICASPGTFGETWARQHPNVATAV